MPPAPEEDWEADHEEGMCAKIGSDGEVAIQRRRAQLGLEVGEVRSLPPHEREHVLAKIVPPFRESSFVYRESSAKHISSPLAAYTRRGVG